MEKLFREKERHSLAISLPNTVYFQEIKFCKTYTFNPYNKSYSVNPINKDHIFYLQKFFQKK